MNLRSQLDRFCGLRPMDPDHHLRQRSRSPQRVHTPPGFRLSPFFAPPGWQPPPPRPDRAVILQIDLRPMQQLALLDNYYDILAPQVYTHLTTADYRSAFILYKIIYPNYVSRHYVQELYELVVVRAGRRHLPEALVPTCPSFPIDSHNCYYTRQTRTQSHADQHSRCLATRVPGQTHQPPLLQQASESPAHPDVPHGNSDATALVMNITCEPTAPSANLDQFPDSTSH